MIQATNLSKSFGDQKILDSISFNVNPRERIGLTGRNGHGKTTLIRMITGEEAPDSGEISIPKNYTLGYVSQHIKFTEPVLIDEACSGLPEDMEDQRWIAEKILSGLGFEESDFQRSPGEFSGGYQVRLNLAKILVSEPDMLLLDEPTNYLDIVSIRWLANYLRQWKGELILVTHDRTFMDAVTTHTIGIHRRKTRKIEGGTDKLNEQILKEEEIHEKTRINDEKKRKDIELFITRFRAKARLAGLVQSRVKALEKSSPSERLENIKNLDFQFTEKSFPGKIIFEAENISFAYDENKPLIENFSLTVRKGDRICVIGKNGRGKTTLLKLLSGELEPQKGSVKYHPAAAAGYFAQTNSINLIPHMTVEEEIMSAGCERQRARDIAGGMMFEGDAALKKIEVLSGGEKSRVLLGKILANPSNILFLDEPSNHLDMESCDTLLEALHNFDGSSMMVTHNELFLHTLPNKLILFTNSGIRTFEGGYRDFLERIGWEEEKNNENNENETAIICDDRPGKKDLRRLKADLVNRRSKALRPIEKEIISTENEIENAETETSLLNEKLAKASMDGDGQTIASLSKELSVIKNRIDDLYEKYEHLTSEQERLNEEFEKELEVVNS